MYFLLLDREILVHKQIEKDDHPGVQHLRLALHLKYRVGFTTIFSYTYCLLQWGKIPCQRIPQFICDPTNVYQF